ncbi:hypothetical protein HALLA_02185 (plasmid) [Halostagnicola larsenii XH-48]|uniref:Uncharacterized protein n=1 Tax=Halostagnicola larsenii XH-48 TaxID=797299 RepID=W0JVA4_9EURY|nr:hypothetical protein HALLA_02185 [Halostagnicola larsenii XH-48]
MLSVIDALFVDYQATVLAEALVDCLIIEVRRMLAVVM